MVRIMGLKDKKAKMEKEK